MLKLTRTDDGSIEYVDPVYISSVRPGRTTIRQDRKPEHCTLVTVGAVQYWVNEGVDYIIKAKEASSATVQHEKLIKLTKDNHREFMRKLDDINKNIKSIGRK